MRETVLRAVVLFVLGSLLALPCVAKAAGTPQAFDVVVYGGTCAGVTAAVEVARGGKHVALLTDGRHVGGLTTSGLGWTDMGNPVAVGGMAREFYHRLFVKYQDPTLWKFGPGQQKFIADASGQHVKRGFDTANQVAWIFEPHVAESVYEDMLRESGVTVVRGVHLDRGPGGVVKTGERITKFRTVDGNTYAAKIFIDATYAGDLMAAAGVKYTVGREANSTYGETGNGIQVARATNIIKSDKGVDGYKTPGDPKSGLLPGVNADPGGPDGSFDARIQAYCYRLCLTDVPENRVPIEKPAGYDPAQYELLFRCVEAGQTDNLLKNDIMPNRKTDTNNGGGISTDLIGGSYDYPEADDATRLNIADAHKQWQLGLLWSLQNSPRVPAKVRQSVGKWGLAKDEFPDNGNWPYQIYVREARRMVGVFVEAEPDLLDDKNVARPIGMGVYTIDSHYIQRYVDAQGHVKNEGGVGIRLKKPYRIDYGCITPKADQCTNLLVPVCLSASHIAYGSIRMEPVFMVIGHSAGVAACMAIDSHIPVQQVPYDRLRDKLLAEKQVLSN